MDFRSYVPDGARRFAEHYLQGSPELGWEGYEAALSEQQAELAQIDRDIRDWSRRLAKLPPPGIPPSYDDKLSDLRERRDRTANHAGQLELNVTVIRRLICDPRMEEVYRALSDTFFGEADLDRKIDQFRARMKRARDE